jgi:hypothetical protein
MAKDLRQHLVHYDEDTAHRHLFLATGDVRDTPVDASGHPLALTYGPTPCLRGGPIVVPPPNLERGLAAPASGPRDVFAYWGGAVRGLAVREAVLAQLQQSARPRWSKQIRR